MAQGKGQDQGQGQGNRFLQLFRRPPAAAGTGVVIAFPDSARLKLERLARELHQRFAQCGGAQLFALEVTAGPCPRLVIDEAAVVACNGAAGTWQVTVDHDSDTRLTLDSADFASIERFVRLYIVGRLSELVEGALLS